MNEETKSVHAIVSLEGEILCTLAKLTLENRKAFIEFGIALGSARTQASAACPHPKDG